MFIFYLYYTSFIRSSFK